MSDDDPTGPIEHTQPIPPAGAAEPTRATGEFETVGPEKGPARPRRLTVISGVAVAVVALLGGGTYAAYSFLGGGGPQPADVLPSSTVAVVSVDLDPSAGQKIAALKSIRKFPALKQSLGLQPEDDVRQFVVDKIIKEADCKGLDFAEDVKPWLGERAAVAAVDLGEPNPSPVIALQISDKDKAQKGFQALVDCTDPKDFGFAVGDDYLVGSDTSAHARAVLDRGTTKPLSDDAAYQKWTDEAGDAGVVSFYVASRAANYLVGYLDDMGANVLGLGAASSDDSSSDDPLGPTKKALKGFRGLGGTVRFADGGMEMAVAGGGITQLKGLATVGQQLGDLPADTAIALGFGVSDGYASQIVTGMGTSEGSVADAEQETGLDLPEDLQTLLGSAVTLSLGGHAPASFDDIQSPEDVPAGLVIHGDGEKIRTIIATVEDHTGMHLSDVPLVLDSTPDKVVLATSRGYADDLLKAGELSSDDHYRGVVPNASKSNGVLFVDFDSPWRDTLVGLAGSEDGDSAAKDVDANTRPLRSLGLSSWQDGDISHALLKITTD